MKLLAFAILAVGMLLLAGCTQPAPEQKIPSENKTPVKNSTQLANPASVNCVNNGAASVIDANTQTGYCVFPNGSKCEEWAFFRTGICSENQTQRTNRKEGEFCGGIAGFLCADGLECKYDGSYPDAGGTCVKKSAGLANPASVNCVDKGGKLRIVNDAEGQYGMCQLNGIECEEWDFFRSGKCVMTLEKADAYDAALQFAKITPTYAFDGMNIASKKNETLGGGKYNFTFAFSSRQGGYGNRAGQMLTDAITPHTLVVTVGSDKIIGAVTDGKYDEMKRKMIAGG